MPSSRVDYDAIADDYDSQPYRAKSADPELAAFLANRGSSANPRLLDIACGTGNQLIANRTIAPRARMIGIDGSFGMLRQAKIKSPDIGWLQADAASLPLAADSVDFVSCQYAFHHFRDKTAMLNEALRVLRGAGRMVIYNLCPQEMPDWIYYAYFPEAQRRDLADFLPLEQIIGEMRSAGFETVTGTPNHIRFDHDLAKFLETARRRDNNSQLIALSDEAYAAGLRVIERDMDDADVPRIRPDHLCFVTIRGDKPDMMAQDGRRTA
jgi:ubiquinone/menaquinone biosynthesis C-methylase UbiE